MLFNSVKKCKIMEEFTNDEKENYFGMSQKKTLHHIDTLYYTITLNEADETSEESVVNKNIMNLINELQALKDSKMENRNEDIVYYGLSLELKSVAGYIYCLSLNENYDIFIAKNLPNDYTPRIIVQLRTRALILKGVRESVEESFEAIKKILDDNQIEIVSVSENRIDYAYHTNLVQNTENLFNDKSLNKNLVTKMRKIQKVGNMPTKDERIKYDYLALGVRGKSAIYFRAYEKTREVVEMNYKSFFIERWRHNRMISSYDYYVLSQAFESKSYDTGMLVGRINWYLEHGKDEPTKSELQTLKKSCYEKSDNNSEIRRKLKGLLPEVTVILNFEYQTMHSFYKTFEGMISAKGFETKDGVMQRLYTVLSLHKPICKYLTHHNVSFREKDTDEYVSFWKRIQATKIYGSDDGDIIREYSHKHDVELYKKRILGGFATLNSLYKKSLEENDYEDDITTAIGILNDNDIKKGYIMTEEGEMVRLANKEYDTIKRRRVRKLRGIIDEENKT